MLNGTLIIILPIQAKVPKLFPLAPPAPKKKKKTKEESFSKLNIVYIISFFFSLKIIKTHEFPLSKSI